MMQQILTLGLAIAAIVSVRCVQVQRGDRHASLNSILRALYFRHG
jgi:hypothetical protein